MMNSLGICTIVMIIYQTVLCVLISWFTLTCRLVPDSNELYEVTLMKLLYLYDPEACGRIYFYNFTIRRHEDVLFSTIMWPVQNPVATKFRSEIRLWLALHIIWLTLSIINATHGRRPCAFYAVLVPFTLTGLAMLIVDVIFAVMFLEDVQETNSDIAILDYINQGGKSLRWIIKVYPGQIIKEIKNATIDDTSWIPLLFAYASCRGVVQWIINFWLIKDNYFAGLANYRQLQKETSRDKARLEEKY